MGSVLIQNGWIDRDFIRDHVHGFEAYAAYAAGFNEGNVEQLTGVPYDQVVRACEMIRDAKSISSHENSAPIPHHKNGLQNYRAITALLALTGNFDREGGQLPTRHTFTHQISGFETREEEWMDATEPAHVRPAVGDLPGLYAADKVDIRAGLQKRKCLFHQSIALLLLGADIHNGNPGMFHAYDMFHINRTHSRKLYQMRWPGVHIGSAVNQKGYSFLRRDERR